MRAAIGSRTSTRGEGQAKTADALAWTGLVRLVVAGQPPVPPNAPAAIAGPAGAYLPPSLHGAVAEMDWRDPGRRRPRAAPATPGWW